MTTTLPILITLGAIIVFLVIVFGLLTLYLTRTLVQHREFYNKREKWLISAIMAKDLPELAHTANAIMRTPEDDLRQTELENELAINAQELIQVTHERGIPV
jgi:hypothetical protein